MATNMAGCWSTEPGLHEDGRGERQVSLRWGKPSFSPLPNGQAANREEASRVGRKFWKNEVTQAMQLVIGRAKARAWACLLIRVTLLP